MEEFALFNLRVHKEEFIQLNIEYMTWISEQLEEIYQFDVFSVIGQTIPEWVDDNLEPFTSLKPPGGILYMLVVEGEVAGMGALRKLSDEVGEIKRMYNRPHYRGRGLGKKMLNKLLEDSRKFGCSSFMLDTPKWAHAAQHIYKSAGFKERDGYPESEIPSEMRPYWMFMERK